MTETTTSAARFTHSLKSPPPSSTGSSPLKHQIQPPPGAGWWPTPLREVVGNPTDTAEVRDPCWPQGTSPAAESPLPACPEP